jgi:hypothetical protein
LSAKWQQRKHIFAIERRDIILHGDEYNFTEENKKEMLKRFLNKQYVKCFLPEFARDVKEIKCKLALLESLKAAYM